MNDNQCFSRTEVDLINRVKAMIRNGVSTGNVTHEAHTLMNEGLISEGAYKYIYDLVVQSHLKK